MSTPILDERTRGLIPETGRCVMRKATVLHSDGIHLRPAAELVQLVRSFQSVVRLVVDGCGFEAESVIGLLSANLWQGRRVTVIAEGADAETAAEAVVRFFSSPSQPSGNRGESPLMWAA